MSLLENFPHRCSIFRIANQPDGLGGGRYVVVLEQSDVECWEQQLSASEIMDYQKRGINVTNKVFFNANPNVTERHRLLITKRFGVATANLDINDVANPDVFDVSTATYPDASAGLAVLWKVMARSNTASTE